MFGQAQQTFDPYTRPEINNEFLKRVRVNKEKHTCDVLGTEIVVFPEVFSPKHDTIDCLEIFVKHMVSPYQKRVLDVGTGTGALALYSAMKGASLVHAIDINPNAVENARANFEKHNFGEDRCLAYQSDLFKNVKMKFDVVLFNPPHQGFETEDMLEKALTDGDYSTVKRFFSEVSGYLSDDGTVCFEFSELGDLNLLEKLIKNSDLVVENIFEEMAEVKLFIVILKKKPQP